jgi:outer membrane protein TolC
LIDKQRVIFSIILLSVLLIFSAAFCQEVKTNSSPELNLTDIVLLAFKNNKDIQIQEKEIIIAQADILGVTSVFLPQVNLKGGYTHNDKVLAENIFTGYRNDYLANLMLSESIYNGGANIASFK